MTKVIICNMSDFKAFGMMNLQYEKKNFHKIHYKGTRSKC